MTTKQFNWLRGHQPFHVCHVDVYDCKRPKDYHNLRNCSVVFNGGYFVFSGHYDTYDFKNKHFVQHYVTTKIHYRNIRRLSYILENEY